MKPRYFLFAFLTAVSTAPLQAENELFFDTVDVRVLNLEVVVEDKEGHPVRGLTRDDFELLEDAKTIEISNFLAIEDGREIVDDQNIDPSGPQGGKTDRLNLAVFFDEHHLSLPTRQKAIESLSRLFRTSLGPDDQVMVARFKGRVEVEQKLTNDRALLEAALARLADSTGTSFALEANFQRLLREIRGTALGKLDTSGAVGRFGASQVDELDITEASADTQAVQIINLGEQRTAAGRASFAALHDFVDSLAGLNGRKALLLVTDGIPIQAADSLIEAWTERYETWARLNSRGDLLTKLNSAAATRLNVRKELAELMRHAASSQVSFYPFSPGSALRAGAPGLSAESSGGSGEGSGGSFASTTELFESESGLLQMAEATGGVALTRSANIEKLFDRLRHDFTTFYSLGYRPQESDKKEGRKLEVRTKNKDWKIRHAAFASDRDPLEKLQDLVLSTLYHGLAINPLDLRLEQIEQTRSEGNRVKAQLMVKIPFEKLLLLPEEEFHSGRVTLYVIVRDEASKGVSALQRIELPLRIPNDQILEALGQTAAYPLALDLTPGHKRIAIGARDHLARADATASLEIDIVMPQGGP